MKKILILAMCLLMVCVFPLSAFAEEETTYEEVETEETVEPEVPAEPETPTNEVDWDEVQTTVSGFIMDWIKPHIEEISVIVTLIFYVIASAKDRKNLNKNMGVMNNNTIAIANNSNEKMTEALALMQTSSDSVVSYDERIATLLDTYAKTLEDNKKFREEYIEMKKFLKSSTEANIEFANELAELLALANIPNYKKEELGRRHTENVAAIREAESKAELPLDVTVEEVKENVEEA